MNPTELLASNMLLAWLSLPLSLFLSISVSSSRRPWPRVFSPLLLRANVKSPPSRLHGRVVTRREQRFHFLSLQRSVFLLWTTQACHQRFCFCWFLRIKSVCPLYGGVHVCQHHGLPRPVLSFRNRHLVSGGAGMLHSPILPLGQVRSQLWCECFLRYQATYFLKYPAAKTVTDSSRMLCHFLQGRRG